MHSSGTAVKVLEGDGGSPALPADDDRLPCKNVRPLATPAALIYIGANGGTELSFRGNFLKKLTVGSPGTELEFAL